MQSHNEQSQLDLSPKQFLQWANQLQLSVRKDLRDKYTKTSDYHLGLFTNRSHQVEEEIVAALYHYNEIELKTFPQIAFYLNKCDSILETKRKKSVGGMLGEILNSYGQNYKSLQEEFWNILHKRKIIIDWKLALYRNELAMIEETNFAEWLQGNDLKDCPERTYHLSKLRTLIEQLELKKVDTDLSELQKLTYKEQRIVLKRKITELVSEKVHIDFTEIFTLPTMKGKNDSEIIKCVLRQIIFSNFMDNLINEEKQFFWRWSLHAKFSNLNSTRIPKSSPYHPINKSQTFLSNTDHDPLLKLNEFQRSFKILLVDECNEEIIDDCFKSYMLLLKEYNNLHENELWKKLMEFDDCEWGSYLKSLIETELKKPLKLMETLIDKMEDNSSYVPNKDEQLFYDLYLELKINICQVNCLESINQTRPVPGKW